MTNTAKWTRTGSGDEIEYRLGAWGISRGWLRNGGAQWVVSGPGFRTFIGAGKNLGEAKRQVEKAAARVLRISDEDPTSIVDPFETTLAEFVEANADGSAADVVRNAGDLKVGESFLVGGGAAPVVRIERVR